MFVKNLKVLLSVFIFSFATAVLAAPPKYPVITAWQGTVWLTGKEGQRQPVSGKTVLREKALLQTSPSGFVKIQLDGVRTVSLLASTEVSFPAISWEGGEAPVLILKSGDIYWEQALGKSGAYKTALRSDLFEFLAPPGSYILSMDPGKAFASVKMLEGSMVFAALNAEDSVTVKAGQQVGFQGVIEEGEISYDILLKGKKIPKGALTAMTAVDPSILNKRAENEKKHLAEVAAEEKRHRAATERLKKEGFICAKPPGKFNQCAWVCTGNPKSEKKRCLASEKGVSCVRQRCNANGQWADPTALDAEKGSILCSANPVVAACDY